MEWLVIYLFVMIEKIAALLALGWVAFWLGAFILVASIVVCAATAVDSRPKASFSDVMAGSWPVLARKICKWAMILGFIFGSISVLIPDQKNMAIIAGTGITYKAVTSETGQRLGGKAISLLEQKMDEALNDVPASKETVAK